MKWPPSLSSILPATLVMVVAASLRVGAQQPGETLIEIRAVAGMRYDIPRFKVTPSSKVRLRLENADDMAHNLVITTPGARLEVANAAMTLPLTPTQDFLPKTEKVLHAIPVLTPGKQAELAFTAPDQEGVYPYVCTYPGHGMVMFGAMYVTRQEMPALESDPHVPESAKELANQAPLHAFTPQRPYLYRTFVRDSGPASIAVALPGEQNYCWDAGACCLRYAWRGAFLDPRPQWAEKGDGFAEVKGRIYWRAGEEFPLRVTTRDKVPSVKFRGYRLIDRYPEFHYEVDGVEVRELIKAPHHGSGLETTFTIAGAKGPVSYLINPNGGATFVSSAGEFVNGVLTLSSEQARSFTVTLIEIPGREPLGYWSMDDVLSVKKPFPVPGVKGRALTFDGKKAEFATGLRTDALAQGATFSLWLKARDMTAMRQVVLGARADGEEFAIGWNLDGREPGSGFGYKVKLGGNGISGGSLRFDDLSWQHLVVTSAGGKLTLFHDGQNIGTHQTESNLPANAPIFLGSLGGVNFAAATLDEVRIYDRVLPEEEIRALYETVRAQTTATLHP